MQAVGFHALRLAHGPDFAAVPSNWSASVACWGGLRVGCDWSALPAAGAFRVVAAGVAAVPTASVPAAPVRVVPLVHQALLVPAARSIAGLHGRLPELAGAEVPQQGDRRLPAAGRLLAQPVGAAMLLSLKALIRAREYRPSRRGPLVTEGRASVRELPAIPWEMSVYLR
ncbi:hypothetical protein GCM10010381_39910 [Streptomyces xantholiticus]|nr:hypothetical protein GCM10010381_39910 [Streptomyces xantholiticus]